MRFKQWLETKNAVPLLPLTPENLDRVKKFLILKWQERAKERMSIAQDLSGACKFASLFAQRLFGGILRGNWHHQYLQVGNQIIDLTDAAGVNPNVNPYTHDKKFWMNPDHKESLQSCENRVNQWVQEFLSQVQ